MRIVVLGLSLSSSWGNGHATTYRGLLSALAARGHEIVFLERDQPWYREHRDLPDPSFCTLHFYSGLKELQHRFNSLIAEADAVILGSYVPEGRAVGRWVVQQAQGVRAFYDIDTPVTLSALKKDSCDYIDRATLPEFDLYLSFTGGPALELLRERFGAQRAEALYCSADPTIYFPEEAKKKWDLGYLGTYSADRQPALQKLLLKPAINSQTNRFVVAGSLYPDELKWPANVERVAHLAPADHRQFYAAQRFTLNITRAEMVLLGYSPSVRLFEAAACGIPIISDEWPGLKRFFVPGEEILLARTAKDVSSYLDLSSSARQRLGRAARARIEKEHTPGHRAQLLERLLQEASGAVPSPLEYGMEMTS